MICMPVLLLFLPYPPFFSSFTHLPISKRVPPPPHMSLVQLKVSYC